MASPAFVIVCSALQQRLALLFQRISASGFEPKRRELGTRDWNFETGTLNFEFLQHHIPTVRAEALTDKMLGFVRGKKYIGWDNVIYRGQPFLGNVGSDRFDGLFADAA